MSKLAAAILTKNAVRHIADCINSLRWVDTIFLEDSFSDDGTVDIAQRLGAQVFQGEFVNFAVARNAALHRARNLGAEWVFFVDADERVMPELGGEIQQVVGKDEAAGYWIPRYNVMWGHVMRGGGWYPDHQLRLMRVDAAWYDPERQVHEFAMIDGRTDYLKGHLIHYNYDSLVQFKFKQDRYIEFEAKILRDKNIKAKPWTYITMPVREFRRRFFTLKGYKDGWVGLQVCSLMSWYVFVTYLRLRKLYQTS
jgi:glycosyltransferase involved in cell wall biosynthesis